MRMGISGQNKILKQKPEAQARDKKMKKAFTIIELLVAMTIIVIILAGSGYVFHTAVQAERVSRATAEISRKLRGITDQLNADFKGIRYDGEILVAWQPVEIKDSGNNVIGYNRFDQIMLYANGNFNSYSDSPLVKGDLARIQYMIARPDSVSNVPINPADRILTRVQHIVSPDTTLPVFPVLSPPFFNNFVDDFIAGERDLEYDSITMEQWKNIDVFDKEEMLTVITDLLVDLTGDNTVGTTGGTPVGVIADASNAQTVHKVFCEGVGEFIIQDWYALEQRWKPEIDIDGDGNWATSPATFTGPYVSDWPLVGGFLDLTNIYGWYYPGDDTFLTDYGRVFKFTFTLYDSLGIFPDGKTFSHIIYLD